MSTMLLPPRFRHVVFPVDGRRTAALNFSSTPTLPFTSVSDAPRLSQEQWLFLRWLFSKTQLDVRAYRRETLLRRLPACLRFLRASSPEHARKLLEQQPALVTRAMSVMLVGVTSFFRDADVFEWLATETFAATERPRPGFYVWSAGCSDGAELYTVALLLAEAGKLSRSYLLGTDCRSDAVERARSGVFDDSAFRSLPVALRNRYLRRHGERWEVESSVRVQLRWNVSNVLKGVEPGAWDIILCRNTGMYLSQEALAVLWPRLENSLRPGGLLILGRAERPTDTKRLAAMRPCVYRRLRT